MRRSIDSAGTANRAAREDRFFGITVGRFRQTHRECSIIRCGSSIAPDRDTAVYATRELGIAMANHGDRKSEEAKRPADPANDLLKAQEEGKHRRYEYCLESTLGLLPWPVAYRQQAIS